MAEFKETAFEYINEDKHGTFSTSEQKWINKITKYAEQYPDEVKIVHINEDGSLVAHAPKSWFKFSPKKKREYTEEQLVELRQRAVKMQAVKNINKKQ